MEHAGHTPFIVAAYVIAGLVIGAIVATVVADYLGLRRALARFGPRGLDSRE